METINKERIASVTLLTSRSSEDELALFEASIAYALDSLSDDEIGQRFGASRDELEGARDDLLAAIAELRESEPEPQPVAC
jgi:hypothetical protein